MMIKYFLLLLTCGSLFADDIVIQLPTQKSLQPIYIAEFHTKNSPYDANYCKQLEAVLLFDFTHNGRTKLADRIAKFESILSDANYQNAFYPKVWEEFQTPFVISARIENKQLHTAVYISSSSIVKHFRAVDLTGRLCDDRRLIHRLSDGIFKELFHTAGIASSRILYSYQASKDTKSSDIWECDYDGANAYPLTRENAHSLTPTSFSRDQFLYACYKSGQTKIFLNQKGSLTGSSLIHLGGNQFHPTLSQSRTLLAFTSDNQGRNDLFLQHLSSAKPQGKPQQIYAFPKSVTASPSFSPDEQKLAFVSDKSGAPKIYLIPISNTSVKRPEAKLMTAKHNSCVCPAWSPDGKKIAYVAKVDGVRQIWLYNTFDQSTTQLTYGPYNKENPSWASNSLHLVYNTTDGDIYDLYLINTNDPTPTKITNGAGLKHYPSWSSM